MKKGFTLLELLIAFLISVLVISAVYSMLNSTINYSIASKEEGLKINTKYNLNRIITEDITSLTDISITKETLFGETSFKLTTMNSIVLNKAVPVTVTYFVEDKKLYRVETNENIGLNEKFELLQNVQKFDVLNFDSNEYKENFTKINILKFIITTNNDSFEVIAGNIKL
ncbi:prepilin-type N-terminal cleavage/methylation domain-containing protein [Deferribacterales bacterium Es71-Z0220]|jgi:prepilin-type N-terminal cleavage/methylation domain-containing protein|uniref:PulJ/GspJ family protein n=1 Tax=Deferrivibrio essentukiensis TaxID=2880922 RepID=UPI001F61DB9E|nr:prepilin-type N-terminal cleavage/methylation domain-containing protein [Deferrivibrio essentukiensis]MBZ4671821.1 hypothetical protein [Deferribacteraceae bacterium]MCB4205579.1 prepilin-type N-terminal cleavage/methylation domain-containing protein [Deferrivibrio essentukiensis]